MIIEFLCNKIIQMKILAVIIGLFISTLGFAQSLSIQGSVLDGAFDQEPLAFAHVRVQGLDIAAESQMDGSFELNLLEGKYTLIVDFIGYESVYIKDIEVSKSDLVLNPVVFNTRKRTYDLASTSKGQ